jgi:hypothetical protein
MPLCSCLILLTCEEPLSEPALLMLSFLICSRAWFAADRLCACGAGRAAMPMAEMDRSICL